MVNVNEYYSATEFLQAENIDSPMELTIDSVAEQEIGTEEEGRKRKLVVSFRDPENKEGIWQRKLVLNKTNSESIAKLHGPETDTWKGKKIILFKSTVTTEGKFKGKPCIRVDEVPTAGASSIDKFTPEHNKLEEEHET